MKEGWTYKKLGEVCENLRTGLNPRVHFKLNTENAKGYYVTVRELKGFTFEVDNKTDRIDEYAIKRINERSNLKVGDVLYSGTGTIGRTALVQELPTWWNIKEGVYALTPKHDILDSSFLIYAMHSEDFSKKVLSRTSGATVRSIPMKELKEVTMVIPPLCEQQRIVSRLDSAFAHIDELKANAEKKLSEARALFQKALTKAMEPKEGWEEKKLKEIAQVRIGPFGSLLHKKDYISGGIPLVNPIHMIEGKIVANNDYTISEEKAKELSAYLLKANDVIFARRGEIGRCAIVSSNEDGFLCGTGSLFVRFKAKVDNAFMQMLFQSEVCKNYLLKSASGATMLNINAGIVEEMPLTIPPLSGQQRIVSRLDSLSAHVRELEEVLQKTIAECDALKQALLRQVFE